MSKTARPGKVTAAITSAVLLNMAAHAAAFNISEDFSSNPSARWQMFGDAALFQWDSASESLRVTWDSDKPNSFFYVPLDRTLSRHDSFSFEFDLLLSDLTSGEDGNMNVMQIGIGLLNTAATNASWSRVGFGESPNVAEFNCYPAGYYFNYPTDPTVGPSFVSASGGSYAPKTMAPFTLEFPTGVPVHVSIQYDGSAEKITASWSANGTNLAGPFQLVLSNAQDSTFLGSDDFFVNMFSISSYSGGSWNYIQSHGTVDNIVVHVPQPPISQVRGGFSGLSWAVNFESAQGWEYVLERTTDFVHWTGVSGALAGTGAEMTLEDGEPPVGNAFYRVRATQQN